jgi:hypothetical protein
MFKNTRSFAFGLLIALIPTDLFSVYVLHDVDAGMRTNLSRAFSSLLIESLLYLLVSTFIFGVLSFLIIRLLRLHPTKNSKSLSLSLGVTLSLLQYALDLTVRLILKRADWTEASLLFALFAGPAICAIVLIAKGYSRNPGEPILPIRDTA